MTQAETVYADTLNLLGTDVNDGELQETIDREHAAADPVFAQMLAMRLTGNHSA